MAEKYSSEQFWKLYKKLPQELKDALFAEETGDDIYDICKRNKAEKSLGKIVDYVGQVLLGLLPPDDLQAALEKELKAEQAKKVAQEIKRFIFYPVKSGLEDLYQAEIEPLVKSARTAPRQEKKSTKPSKADTYRESIE